MHLVRVPQDIDVVNIRWKPAKLERPAFLSAHVDSYTLDKYVYKASHSGNNF